MGVSIAAIIIIYLLLEAFYEEIVNGVNDLVYGVTGTVYHATKAVGDVISGDKQNTKKGGKRNQSGKKITKGGKRNQSGKEITKGGKRNQSGKEITKGGKRNQSGKEITKGTGKGNQSGKETTKGTGKGNQSGKEITKGTGKGNQSGKETTKTSNEYVEKVVQPKRFQTITSHNVNTCKNNTCLDELTVKEMQRLAKAYSLSGYSNLRRDQLVLLLSSRLTTRQINGRV